MLLTHFSMFSVLFLLTGCVLTTDLTKFPIEEEEPSMASILPQNLEREDSEKLRMRAGPLEWEEIGYSLRSFIRIEASL